MKVNIIFAKSIQRILDKEYQNICFQNIASIKIFILLYINEAINKKLDLLFYLKLRKILKQTLIFLFYILVYFLV